MSGRVIVAYGPGMWPTERSRVSGSPRYHLLGLARLGWRVLYINPPKSVRLRDELRREPNGAENLAVVTAGCTPPFAVRAVPFRPLGEAWRGLVAWRLAAAARGALKALGWPAPSLLWLGSPWHACHLPHWPAVPHRAMHVYDELSESPIFSAGASALLRHWEAELMRGCETVLCSSMPQLHRRADHPGATLLENAVEDDFLSHDEAPTDPAARAIIDTLKSLPRPRFVYGGVADQRLDPEFFAALLGEGVPGSLCLLGPAERLMPPFHSLLTTHPRSRVSGRVPYRLYSHLYDEADVLLLGHRRTPFTDAMLPEKLAEYLATGKPIVAVDMPEVVRLAAELPPGGIRVARSAAEFRALAIEAAGERDPALAAARRALAAQRTWSVQARALDALLQKRIGATSP